ncbi:type IV secretory system conjugative DNA transfer family protein [Legionella sp. CNM-4043-24]|uniref:type IV secretory system conjugative DNA transfer family protein n=1 Tax=Legionella sp. CNM-4043-24 TaxID=3421646 RepID=UPI00403B0E43
MAFSGEDINGAEYISKLPGSKTVRVRARFFSTQHGGFSESQNFNYQSVPLLRSEKIMLMRNSQSLIMRTGFAPVKTEQYIWYCEKAMKGYKQPETQLPAPLADTL